MTRTLEDNLEFESLWKEIRAISKPLGNYVDKADMDIHEALVLYSEFCENGHKIRNRAQVSLFKNELAMMALSKLVN